MNRLMAIIAALLLSLGAVACENTTEGIEEDTQDAGQEVEDAGEAVPEDVDVEAQTEG